MRIAGIIFMVRVLNPYNPYLLVELDDEMSHGISVTICFSGLLNIFSVSVLQGRKLFVLYKY